MEVIRDYRLFGMRSQNGVGISAFILDVNEDVPVNKKVNNNA